MTLRTRLLRLFVGLIVLAGLLVGLFALTLTAIHRWGATDAEVTSTLPGDELIRQPLVRWTHGITIQVPPAAVWPWLAQMGDTRGGYYSYTFIENWVGVLTGATDYQVTYVNADRIHPEWQDPQPGDALIQSVLKVREVVPGQYLLADGLDPAIFNWIWLWQIQPLAEGQQTRLVVRMAIAAAGPPDPVMGFLMDAGGFVMEQNMLHGLKTRAEGGFEPAWIELLEIALWFTALLAGTVAALLFILRPTWFVPLVVAVGAVLVLFILTFIQPPIWLRIVVDVALWAGVWQAWRAESAAAQLGQNRPVFGAQPL